MMLSTLLSLQLIKGHIDTVGISSPPAGEPIALRVDSREPLTLSLQLRGPALPMTSQLFVNSPLFVVRGLLPEFRILWQVGSIPASGEVLLTGRTP